MPSPETYSQSFRTLIRTRTICLALMGVLLWMAEGPHFLPTVAIGWELLFIGMVLSLVFGVLGKGKRLVPFLFPVVYLLDSFLVCVWVSVSGGPVSFYVPFFLLILVSALLVLPPRVSMIVITVVMCMFLGSFYIDYSWHISRTFGAGQINFVSDLLEKAPAEARREIYKDQVLRWFFYFILMIVVCALLMRQIWDREERVRTREVALEQKRHLIQMGELTGRIAHGVNTPLGLISGNLELLMADTRKSSKSYKTLAQIDQYVQRAIRTVRDVLDYGRRSMSEIRPVSLSKIAQAVVAAVQPKLKKAGGKLILDVGHDLPEMMGYPEGLFQAMLNLVENAIDSIDKKGLVTLSAHFELQSLRLSPQDHRGQVKVTVRDTGRGIPAGELQKVFEPFYSTKEFGRGTGLGLAIVKRIVDEHGGDIQVNSRVGEGTVFTLIFPVREPKGPETSSAEDFYYNKNETPSKDAKP